MIEVDLLKHRFAADVSEKPCLNAYAFVENRYEYKYTGTDLSETVENRKSCHDIVRVCRLTLM